MKIKKEDTALVIVDMLYDFIDGSMACHNADNAVARTKELIESLTATQGGDDAEILDTYPILFIRDNHPSDHCSFLKCGGIWPDHCVAGTRGGEIHEDLAPYAKEELTFYKGQDKNSEQYSGFEGLNPAGQSMAEILGLLDIKMVYVCGIATEYCVRNTCEDLLKAGFEVTVIRDCLAYVDKEGHEKALPEMEAEGIAIM